jgi:hypothetical protein
MRGLNTAKHGLTYVALAWTLIICYAILQVSAVESLILLSPITPPEDNFKQLIVFVYGFAVISFMGGSQVPAVFMKKRSYTVQFVFNAIFGFILLLVTFLHESTFTQISNSTFIPFFSDYPVVALEYLSIPYLVMIFFDLYLHGHLSEFSWEDCSEYLKSWILHPHRTVESLFYQHSVLYSLFSVVLVSGVWIVRSIILSLNPGFTLSRWVLAAPNIGQSLDPISRASLMIPVGLALWIFGSALTHVLADGLGGDGSSREVACLLGVSLLPSSLIIVVDLLELATVNSGIPTSLFLMIDFLILLVWPFILMSISVKMSENLSVLRAGLSSTAAILLMVFLIIEGIL